MIYYGAKIKTKNIKKNIYIYIYNNNNKTKDSYIKEAKNAIRNKNNLEIINEDYYEWEISKWRSISNFEYSPKFSLCGYKWYFVNYFFIKKKAHIHIFN